MCVKEPWGGCQPSIPYAWCVHVAWVSTMSLKRPGQRPMLQVEKFTRAPRGSLWLNGRAEDWLAWELWPPGACRELGEEEARSLEQDFSRTLGLCLVEGASGESGTSTRPGNLKESEEPSGSLWPKELITLEPGESSWQVVLKKIQELSDSVRREREEGAGVKGREEQRGGDAVPTLVDRK